MNHSLYTFLGCAKALHDTIQRSSAPDKESALAASAQISGAADEMLAQLGGNASDDEFREFFGAQVTTVLEAIETLKQSSMIEEIHPTLLATLEYYYAAADRLMGGGGWPNDWPSLSSPDRI